MTGEAFVGSLEIDRVAMRFMKAHSIRAMSIAIAREGVLTGNRGYTWAEPEYPITQPDTRFRIASVAKLFTCAAISRLAKTRMLTFETRAFAFLGITGKFLPSQTPDPDIGKVTILQLATQRSGLARDFETAANDGNDFREISTRIGQATVPTRDQLVRFLYGVTGLNAVRGKRPSQTTILTRTVHSRCSPRLSKKHLKAALSSFSTSS